MARHAKNRGGMGLWDGPGSYTPSDSAPTGGAPPSMLFAGSGPRGITQDTPVTEIACLYSISEEAQIEAHLTLEGIWVLER